MRALMRLALDLRDLPNGSGEQRALALDGLVRLVGCEVGIWLDVVGIVSPTPAAVSVVCDVGWAGDAERSAFLAYIESLPAPSAPDPTLPGTISAMQRGRRVMVRHEVCDDRDWYMSAHTQEYRRAARVDSFIGAPRHGDGTNAGCVISVHRAWGRRQFGERERGLLELFVDTCDFVRDPPSPLPPSRLEGLTPRQRDVLVRLARGDGEKQIAWDLGLSPHTVHDHVKALHRHFGVQSRGELLALCLGGARTP